MQIYSSSAHLIPEKMKLSLYMFSWPNLWQIYCQFATQSSQNCHTSTQLVRTIARDLDTIHCGQQHTQSHKLTKQQHLASSSSMILEHLITRTQNQKCFFYLPYLHTSLSLYNPRAVDHPSLSDLETKYHSFLSLLGTS